MSDQASGATWQTRWEASLMGNYGTPPITLTHGRGARVWDDTGKEYLDLLAGIAVSSLGHAHPRLVEAVSAQVARIAHTSNLYINMPTVLLAERLLELAGLPDARVFFANSGTEANEAALKVARRHFGGERTEVVACHRAFHGRTMGSLAVTGQPAKRDPFVPFGGSVTFVEYGDAAALESAVTERTAAVILEPVLGESGVVPPAAGYLQAARRACDASGALLVLDEVQSGIGRTGAWFAFQHPELGPVRPDIVTLAKGLGGGLPIGACIGVGAAARTFGKGDHGSTFGGNPVVASAALAVLATIEEDGLLDQVRKVGDQLAGGIEALDHPLVAGVRGVGLWRAIVLARPVSTEVEVLAREAGFLVNAAVPEAIRLAPPLVLTEEDAQSFVTALPEILARVEA